MDYLFNKQVVARCFSVARWVTFMFLQQAYTSVKAIALAMPFKLQRSVANRLSRVSSLLVALLIFASAGALAAPKTFLGNEDYAPLLFPVDGQPTGLTFELAKSIFEAAQIDYTIELDDWAEAQNRAKVGAVDGLLQINKSPTRLEIFDFSEPVLQSEFSLFLASEDYRVNTFIDLKKRRVGSEAKGYARAILERDADITIVDIDSWLTGFEMIKAGELDAVLTEKWVGEYLLSTNNIQGVRVSPYPVELSTTHIAVAKGDTELLSAINRGIETIRSNGIYDAILDKWRGETVVYLTESALSNQRFIKTLAIGLGISCVLLLFFIVQTLRQKRRLNKNSANLEQMVTDRTRVIERQTMVTDLAISAADLVVYEIDTTTGYAKVVAGQSSWPELYETKPLLNLLGDVLPIEDREALQYALANPGNVAEFLIRHPHTREPVYWGEFGFTEPLHRDGKLIQMGFRLNIDSLVKARIAAEDASYVSQTMLERLNNTAQGGRIGLFRHNLVYETWECNDIFREFYDLPESEYGNVTLELIDSRIDPETRAEQIKYRLESRQGGGQKSYERELLLPDGKRRVLKIYVNGEYEDDKLVAMAGSAFDITNERQIQNELSRTNTRLSELLERQRSLFAVIGHELRTPIASIEMLAKDADLTDTQKINLVEDIAQGLLGVLEDLRVVVAPESIKESQSVNDYPAKVVRHSLAPLNGLLQENKIELHLDLFSDEQLCRFNSQALRQLVINLVKNAALHSGGKNIWVSLAEPKPIGSTLHTELRVEDDGKGVDSSQVNRLFEAYVRGETKVEGSGLGLFISSELAINLGGQIRYAQSSKGGAAFIVSVAFEACGAEVTHCAESGQQAAQTSLAGKRILFAEDDKMLQMLTTKILTQAGAHVSVCGDGEAAVAAYDSGTFDLIITDIMMPKLDGYGLTKHLRESGCRAPIIGATAAVLGSEVDRLIASGADIVIAKPISLSKLGIALAHAEMTRSKLPA